MELRDNQLQVLWISRIDYSKNSGVKRHSHHFYQLLLVIGGDGMITLDDREISIIPNHGYLFKESTYHAFQFTKETITIDIKFTISSELVQLIKEHGLPNIYLIRDLSPFKELFQLSSERLLKNNILLPLQIDVGFKRVLIGMIQDNFSDLTNHSITSTVSDENESYPMVQYLKKHLSSKICLVDLAQHFGFHPHYLIDLFKKNIGMTPMQYLQSLRLEKAREYLEFSSYSIAEIAELIGLTAPYFSRLCCERLGMSPSKLREQMRTVIGKDIVLEKDFSLESQPLILHYANK